MEGGGWGGAVDGGRGGAREEGSREGRGEALLKQCSTRLDAPPPPFPPCSTARRRKLDMSPVPPPPWHYIARQRLHTLSSFPSSSPPTSPSSYPPPLRCLPHSRPPAFRLPLSPLTIHHHDKPTENGISAMLSRTHTLRPGGSTPPQTAAAWKPFSTSI